MKAVIIGYGSTGQRHYRNLQSLGFKDIFVYDPDNAKIRNVKSLEKLSVEALKDFDVAFICSPTSEHVKGAKLAALAGCHLFIEKPLSHNLSGLTKLEDVVREKKLITMVACNMRYHPAISFTKQYIDQNKLGKIYRMSFEYGYYLPYWRPGVDFMKGYAARKETGGGILLDDIHEYDLLFWFMDFKVPKKSFVQKSKAANVTVDTEDIAAGIFLFSDGALGTVVSDYLSQSNRRNFVIVGERGTLSWNFSDNVVLLEDSVGGKTLFAVKNYDVNEMYILEIQHFMKCVEEKKDAGNSIRMAKTVLQNILL